MKDVEKLKTITFFLLCMYRDQNQGNHDDAVDREDGGGWSVDLQTDYLLRDLMPC